ncbi:MAG: aminoacyl-tRNA hydrolase [Campylobacteraceae bacterium]|jgi:PTH1 family peptidyl-tRNA hydrolase|nr:aminoacyl-tRNA hydrolase [Campylobacteraceae bacterium]
MILFVGLGNPTKEYANTRHNIGFMAIDYLVGCHNASLISKTKFHGELYKHNQNLFLKPTTYMNLSGQSVATVVQYYKPDEVVVIHDDIAINLGSIKIKKGGSSGGHNGIKSIDSHIGSEYIRLRLGVGSPKDRQSTVNFVLGNFSECEKGCVEKIIHYAKEVLEALTKESLENVIIKYNSKKGICE